MVDTGESSSSREASPLSDGESLLTLQIQAFLEASEDIDIDQETVEDLQRVLSEHETGGKSHVLDVEDTGQGLANNHPNGNEKKPRGAEGN